MQTSIFASGKTDSVAVALSDGYQKPISGKSASIKKMLKGLTHIACKNAYRHRANVTLIALAMLFFVLPHFAGATDLLPHEKHRLRDAVVE